MDEHSETRSQKGKSGFSRNTERHDVPASPEIEAARKWLLRHSMEHLHGPQEVNYEKDELVVLCLLRNGEAYLKDFVDHYFSLGAKHLVFLDNGSTDGTVEELRRYENVTVLRSGLPYMRYQVLMKRYLIERFGQSRWTLYVDVDELFDYPYSDVVSLKSFLRYLNDNSYTAVVSYMLDMFPGGPLSETKTDMSISLKESHRFYDISNVRSYSYRQAGDVGNEISNEEIRILQGGVQETLFGIYPLLMKHPLVFMDGALKPMDLSDHWSGNARVADITGVLFHYKLSGSLYGAVRREMEERRYVNRHAKYDKYFEVLQESPNLSIRDKTARELTAVNDLIGTRFLVVSEKYIRFVGSDEDEREDGSSENAALERMSEAFSRARSEASLQADSIEELRREVRQLHRNVRQQTRQAGGLRNKLARERQRSTRLENKSKRLEDKAERLEDRVKNLKVRNERLRGKAKRLEDKARKLTADLEHKSRNMGAYIQSLENQIRAIKASRTWRLLDRINRVKKKFG